MSQRKSNMELLRIVSMYLIVIYHCAYHSGFPFSNAPPPALGWNGLAVKTFYFFGNIGVSLFALTTGYFQSAHRFRWGKFLQFLAQVLFYSCLTSFIAIKLGAVRFRGFTSFLTIAFPVLTNRYWFSTAYAAVYLFSPYANFLAKSMDKKTFQRFLATCFVFYSVIPTIFGLFFKGAEQIAVFNRVAWLESLYFMGAYIRMYSPPPALRSVRRSLYASLGLFLSMTAAIPILFAFNVAFSKQIDIAYFRYPNAALSILFSVALFCAFAQMDLPHTPWINRIASTTFGVYLFHEVALRDWLWKTSFALAEKWDSPTLIAQILLASASVFIAGSMIDFARQALESVTLKKLLSSERFQRFEARFDVNPLDSKEETNAPSTPPHCHNLETDMENQI